jgi:putative PIN family toxin of toxin-antitoxin system
MSRAKSIKVMFDANILISAIYSPNGTPNKAYNKASEPPYVLVLCDQIIDEIRRIFNIKFPSKIPDMERFLTIAHYDLVTLTSGDAVSADESEIRDVNDRPILRAAQKAAVDVFVTGDKDFLESTVTQPKIVTAAQFAQEDYYYKKDTP